MMVDEAKSITENRTKKGEISWIRVGVSVALILVGGWFAFQSVQAVLKYGELTDSIADILSVVPVEEYWQASATGKQASLGFMTLVFEPNQVARIDASQSAIGFILTDGLLVSFQTPVTEPEQGAGDSKSLFEKKKEACFAEPVSWWEYLSMNAKEKESHLLQLTDKSIKYNQKGIVIFEGPAVRGIFRKGAPGETLMFCDVWGIDNKMVQTVIIQGPEGDITAEQEKAVNDIIGSVEYMVAEMPGPEEYLRLIVEALQESKWAKEKESIK